MAPSATPELIQTLLTWVPAASRSGGISPFEVEVEGDRAWVCHETAPGIRIPTTLETVNEAEREGLVQVSGRVNVAPEIRLPMQASFTPTGLMRMLQARPAPTLGNPEHAIGVLDVAAAALDEARELVRDLSRAIDSRESGDPERDEGHLAIVRMIIIPELERLPEERPEEINVAERIGFLQRLRTFVWDTRVIGLISLIVNIYTKMG